MCGRYPVSHIERLRIGIDGKGIRTLILFQQCPLRCKYCINPFTWDGTEEPKMLTVEEIYKQILIDRPYILATNGGVTFGGGEPLLQSKAIKEFAEINTEDFSINVETSLNVPRENIEEIVDIVDMYYVDLKSSDAKIYEEYTGGKLQRVLDNLKYLLDKVGTKRVVVRIPTIPEMVDKDKQMKEKAELEAMGIECFDLFDYRIV